MFVTSFILPIHVRSLPAPNSASLILYFSDPPPAGLSPADPTWIGAWWLGFLLIGLATILPSVALFFFPTGEAKNKIDDSENHQVKKRQSLKLFDKHMDENQNNTNEHSTVKDNVKGMHGGGVL